MSEPQDPDQRVDQFIIYVAYGQVMHQFQVFDDARAIPGAGYQVRDDLQRAMDKIIKWDRTTLGSIVRGLKSQAHWPDGMIDSLKEAVYARNYVAHHFLREYFLVAPSEKVREQAAKELANLSVRLDELQEVLAAHLSLACRSRCQRT